MEQKHQIQEGYVSVPGGRVWYQIVGKLVRTPLVVLHGGPGYPHDYLQPLRELSSERPVIFYDQLGCGKSDRPEDAGLWTIERFVEELITLRQELDLPKIHLLGHSWGALLAAEYALVEQEHVQSLIFASPCISMPLWCDDAQKLRKTLPVEVREALDQGEREGSVDQHFYLEAVDEYYRRFVCSVEPKPAVVEHSDAGAGTLVYTSMWGINEFSVSGTLKGYDLSSRLPEIDLPALFTCGKFDEATPRTCKWYQQQMSTASLLVFSKSAHMPHLKETERYLRALKKFLRRVDKGNLFERLFFGRRA